MRTNDFLQKRLYEIWEQYFDDIPRKNLVLAKFGKYSKRQLGSIKWANRNTKIKGLMRKYKDEHEIQDDERISVITITRYFQDENIPEYVLDATLVHELVHYTHGFHSPLKQLYKHPHKGNIVKKEMQKRGFYEYQQMADNWLKKYWAKTVTKKR